MMNFNTLCRDTITLIKQDNAEYKNIKASVQPTKIFLFSDKYIIDEGDIISRTLSNGKTEYYEVLNPVFYEAAYGIPANYQIEVRKTTQQPKDNKIMQNIVYAGNNSKINIASSDNSINISKNNDDVFAELLKIAQSIDENTKIINAILEMQNSVSNKETFREKYNNFIQSAANHMAVFAPFIAEITKYL